MPEIKLAELTARYDFETNGKHVTRVVQKALADPLERLRFLGRYSSWNGLFGSGVASLVGMIGRARDLFLDEKEAIGAVADRSVFVASFFFDAARDEFDDRTTIHRDTHRCLAQAMLQGAIDHGREVSLIESLQNIEKLNQLLSDPSWLVALNDRVAIGYGRGAQNAAPGIFRAMGYHLGSELLADQEFSILDTTLREAAAPLVAYLENRSVEIAGQKHSAYHWIRIHSGHGGGAEADHFDWAVQGVRRAFDFVVSEDKEFLQRQVLAGFDDFTRDHSEFFEQVTEM